jgi:hypothetical protein
MSIRTTLTGDGNWHNIGTGPAIVELVSPSGSEAEVMVECAASTPTGVDGVVLNGNEPLIKFSLTNTIWAQVIQSGATAVLAVQPDVAG